MAPKAESAEPIAVVGAGVVGAATAWSLMQRGHRVELFEQHPEPGVEATASNAGMLVPGDSLPWAAPAAVMTLLAQTITRRTGFIRVTPRAGARLIPWGLRFLMECLPHRVRRNTEAAHALSRYSFDLLEEWQSDLELEFAFRADGMTFIAQDRAGVERLRADRARLEDLGERFHIVEGTDTRLFSPGSGKGDAHAFTVELIRIAQERGLALHRSTLVRHVRASSRASAAGTSDPHRIALMTDSGEKRYSRVVLAAGARTRELARGAGVRLPILPVKGYAITVPPKEGTALPELAGVDEVRRVAYSTTATGLRLSSIAEFSGYDTERDPANYASAREAADALLPGVLDWDRAETFSGWRPATPDSTPLIGESRRPGLFVNSGHSHLGWTQAVGSAELLADLIEGRAPAIDPSPYALG